MIIRLLLSTLFPYTTLFRSREPIQLGDDMTSAQRAVAGRARKQLLHQRDHRRRHVPDESLQRSEEHTSELQSRRDLVCSLLLEKNKINIILFCLILILQLNY